MEITWNVEKQKEIISHSHCCICEGGNIIDTIIGVSDVNSETPFTYLHVCSKNKWNDLLLERMKESPEEISDEVDPLEMNDSNEETDFEDSI